MTATPTLGELVARAMDAIAARPPMLALLLSLDEPTAEEYLRRPDRMPPGIAFVLAVIVGQLDAGHAELSDALARSAGAELLGRAAAGARQILAGGLRPEQSAARLREILAWELGVPSLPAAPVNAASRPLRTD